MATKEKKAKSVNCPGVGQVPAEVLGTLPVPKTSQHLVEGAEVTDWGKCKACGAKRPLLNGKVTHHRVSTEPKEAKAVKAAAKAAAKKAAKEQSADAPAAA
jgi:hypothetical protein